MKQGISIEKTLVFGGGDKKIPVVLKGLKYQQCLTYLHVYSIHIAPGFR